MSKYQVIVYWSDDDHAFIAQIPKLAGCQADGATFEEAIVNVKVVAQEWIATARDLGRPIPEPEDD